MIRRLFLCILILVCFGSTRAQTSIDKIIATIGKDIILQSDLDKAYSDYTAQYAVKDDDEEEICSIFEHLVFTKLMLHQAEVDSVVVPEQYVDAVINQRMGQLLQMTGGNAKVIENFYGKSMEEIKKDFREVVRDQLYVEEVQENLTANITITPSEVKSFVNRIGLDSMPIIPATYEFGHILKTPPVSDEEIKAIRERLEEYREKSLRDDNPRNRFSMFARLYSDDPGSASNGGNLGFVERGAFYPEFEAVAFNLRSGEISNVLKTKAGYHIIQLLERRGESINVAHILLQPKPSAEEQVKTIEYLDSIRQVILDKKMEFSKAALEYSDDPNKMSGGWVINPYTLSTKFDKESMDQGTFATIDKMIPGEFSSPVIYVDEDGVVSYRLLYLKSKVAPHKANLTEDYDVIKNAALEEKKNKAIERWLVNKVKTTSIKINADNYKNCDFIKRWQIN
jgi:peptidyl-prolyl cis-trans isomerase SurA